MMSSGSPKISGESRMQGLAIYHSYRKSKYLSFKHSSYFQVYEELLHRYRNQPVVFVEIGVLNGGSLFMWRDYFGPQARIIGIDLNPLAKQWEKDGFEIHIGSQSEPRFWDELFAAVGEVDVILDDGGHTNEQQIVTAHKAIPHIRDGGMLIVEDTHTSYIRDFGNPSRYSFMSYTKALIDGINSRFPALRAPQMALNQAVWSMGFYESIVCFHVDRSKCFVSSQTSNDGVSFNAQDFRHHQSTAASIDNVRSTLTQRLPFLKYATTKLFAAMKMVLMKWQSRKLRGYFR
jgi:cephalosporin hydroxylase